MKALRPLLGIAAVTTLVFARPELASPAISQATGDKFGDAVAACDFNGDGFTDLVVGVPDEDVGNIANAGAVHVLYGAPGGLSGGNEQVWDRNEPTLNGSSTAGDHFGQVLAAGDFDGDGFCDLAMAAPDEDLGNIVDAGAVHVLYGSRGGLSAANDQIWDQNNLGVGDSSETGDHFGSALAVGDFDSDGFADLAIGVPAEDVGSVVDAGAVHVLYGSPGGLTAANDQVWDQNKADVQGLAKTRDHFGSALAAGDFDNDGFADLAIGVPDEDVGSIGDAGAVHVLYGTATGLSAANEQVWDQNKAGAEDVAETRDHFGSALAVGDFDDDGFADLAIGVPDEDIGSVVDAGAVNVLYGTATGLSAANDQVWHQNSAGVEDATEVGDHFGSALAVGDFDRDGISDLAIGVPGEHVGTIVDAGAVNVLYGAHTGLSSGNDQLWSQNSSNVADTSQTSDRFGAALATGDFDGDGFSDLAIGVPGEDVGAIVDAGAVNVLYGGGARLTVTGNQLLDNRRAHPSVDIDVNDTPDENDDLTAQSQTIQARVTLHGVDGQVQLAVTPVGRATLDRSAVSLIDGGSATITLTPTAASRAVNDVVITATVNGLAAGREDLTIVGITLPQRVRRSNTPAGMPDRIAPRVDAAFTVRLQPNLAGSGQVVTLAVTGQSTAYGTATINGTATYDIATTGLVNLRGGKQTAPTAAPGGGNAGNLRLVARVRGEDVMQSPGFSVAAIPQNWSITLSRLVTGTSRGIVVNNRWASDSGIITDLDAVDVTTEGEVASQTGVLRGADGATSGYLPATDFFTTTHSTAVAVMTGDGTRESHQISQFRDRRTGITALPVKNSGYIIGWNVFNGGARITTSKRGGAVTVNGIGSSAGKPTLAISRTQNR